jgi:hypothetical protein
MFAVASCISEVPCLSMLRLIAALAWRRVSPPPGLRPEIASCYVVCTNKWQDRMIAGFTAGERDYIRRELDMFFSTLPTVAEGFQLKTWRSGPDAGKPKLPPTAKGLIARGLMRLDSEATFRGCSSLRRA